LHEAGIPGIRYLDQGSRVSSDIETLEESRKYFEDLIAERGAAGGASDTEMARWRAILADNEKKIAALKNPSRNFVLFDDKHIEITHKNGEAVGLDQFKGSPEAAAEKAAQPAIPDLAAEHQAIAGDVHQKLVAAGLPAEEAAPNAAVVAARYLTRAQRLGRAIGHALGLYRSEGIDVRGGELGPAAAGRAFQQSAGGGPRTYNAGDVSFSDRAPKKSSGKHEGEAEDDLGNTYSFDLHVVRDGDAVHGVVTNLRALDQWGDKIQPPQLTKVQRYKLEKTIKETSRGWLEDEAEGDTEVARRRALTPQQRDAEDAAQRRAETGADQQQTDRIHQAVDAAVARGWRPEVNENGGWQRPPEFREFASPKSGAKIEARLAEHGISVKPRRFLQSAPVETRTHGFPESAGEILSIAASRRSRRIWIMPPPKPATGTRRCVLSTPW
jgi:hypothetical protein